MIKVVVFCISSDLIRATLLNSVSIFSAGKPCFARSAFVNSTTRCSNSLKDFASSAGFCSAGFVQQVFEYCCFQQVLSFWF